MTATKREIVLIGPLKPLVVKGLEAACTVHKAAEATDPEAFLAAHAEVRAIACSATTELIPGNFMARFPKLQIVSSFGVGYDHVDVKYAAAHGIVVTNTPEVLTEEVADTALGLLLCAVREFPQAERYLRAGKWLAKGYPLSKATLRNRTVALSAWARSARRSRVGSARSACRSSITRGTNGPNSPIVTTRSSSIWRVTSTRCWSLCRAARRR